MKRFYKQYIRCPDDNITTPSYGLFGDEIKILESSFTFNGQLQEDGSYTAPDSWFTQVNGWPSTDTYWLIDANGATMGTYYYSWTGTTTGVEYIVEFTKLDCLLPLSFCPTADARIIIWLNRQGGYSSFAFVGKTIFQVTIPEGKSFIQGDNVKRYSDRPGVYDGEIITTGSIPQVALDLLESLKYCVQAYVAGGNDFFFRLEPIFIDAEDFIKRKTGDNFFDVSVRFVYAERVQIQSQ
jgi:hypothetical protein